MRFDSPCDTARFSPCCSAALCLGLSGLNVSIPGLAPSTLYMCILLFGELFLLSWCLGRLFEGEISLQQIDVIIFEFLLASLFLLRLFMHTSLEEVFSDVPAISRIQPYLRDPLLTCWRRCLPGVCCVLLPSDIRLP